LKITTRQLEGHLKKEMAALYAVHGAEALLALEAADRIRESARKSGCTEREVFFAEPGADWGKLAAGAANMSLFASRRLVELRIPTGKPGTEGARAIEAWCAKLPDDAVSLVLLPDLDWQQRKSKWFEALDRAGVVVEAKPVTRDELPDWLAERLARQAQRASVQTLEWLAERVEGNLLAARQEVEKLALLLPAGEITLAAIRESVTDVSRFERDTLIGSLASNNGDAVIASIAETPDMRRRVDFSEPYYRTPARFVAPHKSDIDDIRPEYLEGKKIAVVAGTAHEAFLRALFTEAEPRPFPNDDAARFALKKGEVDLLFGDGISLAFWLNGTDSGNCCEFRGGPYLESRFFGEGVGIAVRRNNDLLRQAFNWALFRLWEKGRFTDLWLRYFPISPF